MAAHSFSRLIWRISLPIILVEATETFDHLIDTLFLARVGVTELGAIAVADSVLLLFLILPFGLVDAIQILTARRAGQRRPDQVGAVFNQGLILMLLLSAISTLALKFASPLISEWLVESEPVGEAVDGYLQIDAYSIGLTGFTFACSALLTSVGRTWALFPATLILVVTDVALNYLFIFGKFGCPALGIRGAAIGSLGAEFATSVFLAVYLWRLNASRYGFFRFRRPDRRITRLLFRSGGPIALQAFLESLRWFFFFLIFERVSTQALAIANLAYTCYIFFRIPTVGFAETACSMVSRWVGRNRPNRIGGVVRQTIGGAALATVPFIAAALLVPQWVLVAFLPESDLLLESSDSLRVVALAMLIAIPGEMWFVAVMGTGDTLAALGIELMLTLTMLGITYLSAIYLAWPVAVVWLSVPVAWLVCLGVSYGWMKSGIWKRLEY